MEFHPNALKRGFSTDDLWHVYRNVLRVVPQATSPERDLYIGPLRDGTLMEMVIESPDSDEAIVIHAMVLRTKFYRFLEGGRA